MKFSTYSEPDRQEIETLFIRTFSDSEGESEGKLIRHLVHELMTGTETDDLFGFIATEQEQIVGCIFFTRLSFGSPVKAFMLSPVAVDTGHQGKGIGQKLIKFGIKRLMHWVLSSFLPTVIPTIIQKWVSDRYLKRLRQHHLNELIQRVGWGSH